jgi:protein TonB
MADAAMTPRPQDSYAPPLSVAKRGAILALVIFFHVGGGWALTLIEPPKLTVGDQTSIEVRMVPAEQPAEPDTKLDTPTPEDTPPPEPQPVRLDQPPPEDTPPPEIEPVKIDTPPPLDTPPPEVPMLEAMVSPPTPDLPPPEFPVVAPAPPPPPPKPKPPPPPPKPRPQPAAPVERAPQTAPPSVPQAPKTVTIGQVAYINPPNPIYPARSKRAGEQGRVMLRVLIDTSGRPAQVSVTQSSGHPALDESALSAVRASLLRPHTENGIAQPVWVAVPIDFVLRTER